MCPRLWGRTKGYRQKRSTLSLHSWTHSRCRLPRQIDSLRVDMQNQLSRQLFACVLYAAPANAWIYATKYIQAGVHARR